MVLLKFKMAAKVFLWEQKTSGYVQVILFEI